MTESSAGAGVADNGDLPVGEGLLGPHAFGAAPVRGRLRCAPEDFQVQEAPGFTPTGAGEHLVLQLRKRDANTEWVARRLARWAGVRAADVGYAGLKDRAAVTTQWFSVRLPGPDPDPGLLAGDGIQVLAVDRHRRKIRRGTLRGNWFRLVVRSVVGDRQELGERLAQVAARGVPNYFGLQRFGRGGANLDQARRLLLDGARSPKRHLRGLYLSAARSLLFNRVLAGRVAAGSWDRPVAGDAFMLAGSRSFFVAEEIGADLLARVRQGDLSPTGPLWGHGTDPVSAEAARLEATALAPWQAWCRALESAGLERARRALVLPVAELAWEWLESDALCLQFFLPPGGYATSVLRELVEADNAEAVSDS